MNFNWKYKLGFVCFGLVFGLVISEIALKILAASKDGSEFESLEDLRSAMLDDEKEPAKSKSGSVSLRSIVTPHLNDKIIYTLRPNLDVKFQQQPVSTNSCAMRNREVPIIKPANTYRIAMLGDSFAFGWGVKQEEGFAAVLEDNLNKLSTNGTKFEVLNFGVPGYSTFQEVEYFKTDGIDFDPDAIIVFFIRNDFGFPFFVRSVTNDSKIFSSVSFLSMLQKATDPELEMAKLEMQRLDPNWAITELSDFARERGIKLFIAINPKKGWKEDYSRIRVLNRRKDITTMIMRKNYLHTVEVNAIDEKDLTLSNDPHPSPIRHKMYADLMTTYFMDIAQ
ncbi:MAG: SGNH/GDSL hydrolase family protein [Bdellovibrionales bacterium]|nr:SGNH/GDSL hydrolase family protein [Bdellovibrionales bacterium]